MNSRESARAQVAPHDGHMHDADKEATPRISLERLRRHAARGPRQPRGSTPAHSPDHPPSGSLPQASLLAAAAFCQRVRYHRRAASWPILVCAETARPGIHIVPAQGSSLHNCTYYIQCGAMQTICSFVAFVQKNYSDVAADDGVDDGNGPTPVGAAGQDDSDSDGSSGLSLSSDDEAGGHSGTPVRTPPSDGDSPVVSTNGVLRRRVRRRRPIG
eukprot:COSAG06_NODE_13257_length_1277_cov_2.910866_1_plen_215_part_00